MEKHISSAFDEDLAALAAEIDAMGALADAMVGDACRLIVGGERLAAERVIAADERMDAHQRAAEDRAVLIIAKRQPVAVDLRIVVAAMRAAGDLERIGDLAKSMSKRIAVLGPGFAPTDIAEAAAQMGEAVRAQLEAVMSAYAAADAGSAVEVWRDDAGVDRRYNALFRATLTHMAENPRTITACTHLLFCAKNIERMGDHCTNIAETVYYRVTGESIPGDRPKEGIEAAMT